MNNISDKPGVDVFRSVWLALIWPSLRMMLKIVAGPLALFIGLPSSLLTLACLVRGMHMVGTGKVLLAGQPLLAAWVCATVAALAFWPRRNL